MSHLHLPDGLIAPQWWILGYVVTFLILIYLMKGMKGETIRRQIPKTGIVAALMLIAMSVPLGILPLHISLGVLSGILVGPRLGFIAVFVVNLILALVSHGGITLVGLNTLIIGGEVLLGSQVYRVLRKRSKLMSSAWVATALGLILSLTLMIALTAYATGIDAIAPHHFGALSDFKYLTFSGWTALIVVFALGISLEATATAFILRYFSKVRPDLIALEEGTVKQ